LHYRNHFFYPCTGIHVTVGSANVFKINLEVNINNDECRLAWVEKQI